MTQYIWAVQPRALVKYEVLDYDKDTETYIVKDTSCPHLTPCQLVLIYTEGKLVFANFYNYSAKKFSFEAPQYKFFFDELEAYNVWIDKLIERFSSDIESRKENITKYQSQIEELEPKIGKFHPVTELPDKEITLYDRYFEGYHIQGTVRYFGNPESAFYIDDYNEIEKVCTLEISPMRMRLETENGEPLFYTKEEAQSYARNCEANRLQNSIANARASIAKYETTLNSYKLLKEQNLTDLDKIKRQLKVINDNHYNR